MKKIIAIMLSLVLTLSLTSCGKREKVELQDVELQAKDVQEIITFNFNSNAVEDDNYVSSEVNAEKNVVVVKLKDNSKENQDAFIHNVFTISTGSTYIKYLKEHAMLVFENVE